MICSTGVICIHSTVRIIHPFSTPINSKKFTGENWGPWKKELHTVNPVLAVYSTIETEVICDTYILGDSAAPYLYSGGKGSWYVSFRAQSHPLPSYP